MEPKKNPTKDMNRYTNHFFLIGLIVSCSIFITAFEWRTEVKKVTICEFKDPSSLGPIELYPVAVTGVNEAPKPVPIKKAPPVIIDPSIIEVTTDNNDSPMDDSTVELPTDLPGANRSVEIPIEPVDTTYIFVEKMPEPVGGYSGFYGYLSKNMKYPIIAKRRGTEGKVIIEFIVNKKGEPTNLKVLNGIGDGCNEEAMRVLRLAKWEPGKQRGRPVMVKMVLPIYFKLNN